MNTIFFNLGKFWVVVLFMFLYAPVSGQWVSHNNSMSMTGNCWMIHYEQQTLYFGIENALFFTPDNGITWDYMNPGMTVLMMARNNSAIVVSDGGTGIRQSTDNGNNWTNIHNNLPPSVYIQGLCYKGNSLFLATDKKGVYRSSDNGNTWTQVSNGLPTTGSDYKKIDAIEIIGQNLFVGTANGVYRSADDGATWTEASTGLPLETSSQLPREITSLAIIGNDLFASPYNKGVYKSSDNGATWATIGMGSRNMVVCASGNDLFACSVTYGLYRSIDNAGNWGYLGLQAEGPLEAGSAGSAIYAIPSDHSSLLVSSDNGTTWNPPTSDYSLYLTSVFINNSTIFTGTSGMTNNIQRSTDNGGHWLVTPILIAGNPVGGIGSFAVFGNSFFAGATAIWSYPGGLFKSDDNGDTWNQVTIGSTSVNSVYSFAVKDNKIFAGTDVGVYYSTNGTNWYYKGLDTHPIYCLCFNGNTLYAGTNAGVYDSPDFGITWGETGLGTSALSILSLCGVNNDIYAGSSIGILHYKDSLGIYSWYPANGGIISSSVLSMANYKNILFATTGDQHVYLTKNAGKTWGDITENLTDSVPSIIIAGYQVYAATFGSGLWSRDLGELTGVDDQVQNPSVSIFPNPAKNQINIRVNEPNSQFIRIEMIDDFGRIVNSTTFIPANGTTESFQLDCSQLTPGIYMVRLISDGQTASKKLVIQ